MSHTAPRNSGLDLVRALAISLVLASHATMLLGGHMNDTARRLLLYLGGFFGVELFFVLSGYLIGTLLIKLFDTHPGRPPNAALWHFWQRRWWRTVPTYLLVVLLNMTLLAGWLHQHPIELRHLLFLQNLTSANFAMMPESWSITVEEWFYLTLPLALSLGAALLSARTTKPKVIVYVLACYIFLFTALRWGWVIYQDPHWDRGIRKAVLWRLDAIAWGCLVAWATYYHPRWLARHQYTLAGLGVALALIGLLWLTHALLTHHVSVWLKGGLFSLASIGLALTLPWWANHGQRLMPWQRVRASITQLSLISYSLYLFHLSVIIPLMRLPSVERHLQGWPAVGVYLLLSLALATLVYYVYERPMTRQRERFTKRPPPASNEKLKMLEKNSHNN